MMRIGSALLAACLLTACTNGLAEHQAELNRLIGHPESEVVQLFGVPSRTFDSGGVKYLAYTDKREDFLPGAPPFPYPYGPPFYGWYGPGIAPRIVTLICETTFAISDGIVRSVVLRGNACG